jgi:hypothetical protein
MKIGLVVGLALLLAVSNGWCALVTYQDMVTLNARMTDYNPSQIHIEETYEHYVGPAVNLDTVTGAQITLDTAGVDFNTSTLSMGSISIIGDAGSIEIGNIAPNWWDPTINTIIPFVGPNLAALVQFLRDNAGELTIVVRSGLAGPNNFEDFWLYSSTLDVTYDNGEPRPVPEPATLILTLGGLLSLIGAARRKR